jgi:hypothetical protein
MINLGRETYLAGCDQRAFKKKKDLRNLNLMCARQLRNIGGWSRRKNEVSFTFTVVFPYLKFYFLWFPVYVVNCGLKIVNGKFQK